MIDLNKLDAIEEEFVEFFYRGIEDFDDLQETETFTGFFFANISGIEHFEAAMDYFKRQVMASMIDSESDESFNFSDDSNYTSDESDSD